MVDQVTSQTIGALLDREACTCSPPIEPELSPSPYHDKACPQWRGPLAGEAGTITKARAYIKAGLHKRWPTNPQHQDEDHER